MGFAFQFLGPNDRREAGFVVVGPVGHVTRSHNYRDAQPTGQDGNSALAAYQSSEKRCEHGLFYRALVDQHPDIAPGPYNPRDGAHRTALVQEANSTAFAGALDHPRYR